MGTKARALLGANVKKIVNLLNQAFADEWLAYYQYWIGAKIAHGQMRDSIAKEMEEHAEEELEHATKITKRIIQLGGTPILEPKEWYKQSHCGYEPPKDPSIKMILKQNIKSEQCAIEVYSKLAKITDPIDPITYHLVLDILEDEIKHEEELEAFLQDLAVK